MKTLFLIFLFKILTFSAFASSIKFADELVEEGDYYRALTILKEIEFGSRGTKAGFESQKKILQIHLKADDFENFDTHVDKLLSNYSNYTKSLNKDVIEAEAAFLLGNYGNAYNLIKKTNASEEKKYFFGAFLDENPEHICPSDNCKAIQLAEAEVTKAKSSKNESLALTLGIIPGLGQIYSGNISSGIGSFLLSSFFAAVSITAFNNDEKAMGIASTAIGGTFYLASIYAGYETARRHNLVKVSQARKKLYDIPVEIDLIKVIWD